jgi:hypothetical protein
VTLSHATQSGRHPHAQRGLDFYPTPPEATAALLIIEKLPRRVWDVSAGNGGITKPLREADYDVIASDIVERDFELDFVGNFLLMTEAPMGVEAIVCNPPYKLATEFVGHALKLVPHVVMLLRLAFLESAKRTPILDTGKLARVHVFKQRLPMMHRDGWTGPRASSAIAFAWFVWERNHRGPTTIDRI